MVRSIIMIDEDKCNGCGLCVEACHEGAIGLVNGKAKLLRDDYCDGLGNCLPACPMNAIGFEEREALAYNQAEVEKSMKERQEKIVEKLPCGCPGTKSKAIVRESVGREAIRVRERAAVSRLNQWPVQIKLVPVNAPYFDGADLLIAADCTAYAHGNFHEEFMRDRITLIGCPKLDEGDYSEKLTAILAGNDIKSVTVVRMEVPCCAGIANAAIAALRDCGKMIPWNVVVLSTDGEILKR